MAVSPLPGAYRTAVVAIVPARPWVRAEFRTLALSCAGEAPRRGTGMDREINLFERYCHQLGVAPEAPTHGLLQRLVRAQLMRFPFENISKLYGAKRLGLREMPTLERYLDEMERFRFGGTCYPNNLHFWSLLRELGFEATLCGADMRGGLDVHVVIFVRVEQRDYLVDVGYGAPFYEPLPCDATEDHVLSFGGERYVLRPRDEHGRSQVDHYRDGNLIHGYLAKPTPRQPDHFTEIVRASYDDAAMFMNALRMIRFLQGRSVSISNDSFIERSGDEFRIVKLPHMNAVVDSVERHFGMPREIVEQATAGFDLARLRDVHG
jgi:arylamine N-acetyltransferase